MLLRKSLAVFLGVGAGLSLCGWGAGCTTHEKMNVVETTPGPGDIPEGCTYKVEETFLDSGQPVERIEGYVDAEGVFTRHGELARWYENGKKKMELHYRHGVMHGPRLTWYDTGQIWARGAYTHGAADGVWTAWFPSGFRHREWHMRENVWDGPYMEYHENGEKRYEVEYVLGKKQGTAIWWSEVGTELRSIEYVDDVSQP